MSYRITNSINEALERESVGYNKFHYIHSDLVRRRIIPWPIYSHVICHSDNPAVMGDIKPDRFRQEQRIMLQTKKIRNRNQMSLILGLIVTGTRNVDIRFVRCGFCEGHHTV
jgi:hypothetical protein